MQGCDRLRASGRICTRHELGRARRVMTYRNLGELILEASSRFAGDTAFQIRRGFRLDRYTFRDVGRLSRQLACWLTARGLGAGDGMVVWAPNMPEDAVLYFGA